MKTYKGWQSQNNNNNADDFKNLQSLWMDLPIPELKEDQVQIRVEWSSMNFKDALALTGKGKILRQLPLTAGIDAAGKVIASKSSKFKEGDEVVVTGGGIGESMNGGYGEVVTVPASGVIAKPSRLSLKDAMILGTAGFTAALAIHQLEKNDLTPHSGSVLVTGATGGVGSLSLLMLKSKGYKSVAWSRKEEFKNWLLELGATTVENISSLDLKTRPLESATWAAAIDNVGGDVLSYILPRIQPHGSVASIGLAKSPNLSTTVFPFILRGVNILGSSSATCPRPLREKVWETINNMDVDWKSAATAVLKPSDLPEYAQKMVAGKIHGRALVQMQ